jgi:hypothetical protein
LGNLSEFLPITFAMGMVGQLNVGGAGLELDALAMANSYWNMTGLAVQYGLNSAMRYLSTIPLCGLRVRWRAYERAGDACE